MLKESWPKNAPIKRVNSPEVEDNTVVLATLVRARAAFDKYWKKKKTKVNYKKTKKDRNLNDMTF